MCIIGSVKVTYNSLYIELQLEFSKSFIWSTLSYHFSKIENKNASTWRND